VALIDGIAAQFLLADRGYDTDEIINKAVASGCEVVIPPKKNRRKQRSYDKHIYRIRHLVENAFLHLKRWRGVATRYAKTLTAFTAAVQIRCIALWLKLLS
jgi:transposase